MKHTERLQRLTPEQLSAGREWLADLAKEINSFFPDADWVRQEATDLEIVAELEKQYGWSDFIRDGMVDEWSVKPVTQIQ